MKVLLTGADGQIGRALSATRPAGIELHTATRSELDIEQAGAVRHAVATIRPAVIVNAAAYTAVDRAEGEPERAGAVNALGAAYLAEAAQALPGCRLVHLSTDYVFDGRSQRAYLPGDPAQPLSVYGATKLQGEQAVVRILADRGLIIRTAWIYAAQGRNFLLTMLRLMRERGAVRVVADQYGTPTAATSVASAIWRALYRPTLSGILHWTDTGVTSWYEFACAIAREAFAVGLLEKPANVTPITTAEYPTAAVRPARSVLDLSSSAAALELTPQPWTETLRATLQTVRAQERGATP